MKSTASFLLSLTTAISGVVGTSDLALSASRKSAEPFSYELYTADIFSWIDGSKTGHVSDYKGTMANRLDTLLSKSKKGVDLAIYGVSKQAWLFDQLTSLRSHRVRVRSVVDQNQGNYGDWIPRNFTYPQTAELPIILGRRNVISDLGALEGRKRAIMHNKFVTVDGDYVWVGSTNMSHTGIGAEYNANASILIRSRRLVKIFTTEFEQMFKKRRFSTKKRSVLNNQGPLKFADGTEVSVYFSPQDRPIDTALIPFIESTQQTLDIGMFYLTDKKITAALEDASVRGVRVRIIVDALAAAHPSSIVERLRKAGVAIRVENWGGKMHMKVAIADNRDIVIGSMNWSAAGGKINDESTLIIRKNRSVARELEKYFARLWRSLDFAKGWHLPRAESLGSINSCSDGIDNDFDGFVDAKDRGCRESR